MEEYADRILDHLRNQELPYDEVIRIYNRVLGEERAYGFDRGCDFIRDTLSHQRSRKKQNLEKKFKLVLQVIDDIINTKEEDEKISK